VQVEIALPYPWLRRRPPDQAEQRAPSAAARPLVEREAQADGVQPGTRIGPVESVPGAEGAQVGLLRQVESGIGVAEAHREPPHQTGVMRLDRLGKAVGGRVAREVSGEVVAQVAHQGDPSNHAPYNSRGLLILAGPPSSQTDAAAGRG